MVDLASERLDEIANMARARACVKQPPQRVAVQLYREEYSSREPWPGDASDGERAAMLDFRVDALREHVAEVVTVSSLEYGLDRLEAVPDAGSGGELLYVQAATLGSQLNTTSNYELRLQLLSFGVHLCMMTHRRGLSR